MSFKSVVGSILHIGDAVAPEVASAVFSPAAGALVGLVLNGITSAEQSGNTTEQTVQDLLPAATSIVNTVLEAKGASVNIDPTQLSNALTQLAAGLASLAASVTPAAAAPASSAAAAAPAST
jgi:hypothetical protein